MLLNSFTMSRGSLLIQRLGRAQGGILVGKVSEGDKIEWP